MPDEKFPLVNEDGEVIDRATNNAQDHGQSPRDVVNHFAGLGVQVSLFDWTQNAAEIWRGSNNRVRREILDLVCLNRTLGDLNLYATKRKPFDVFAEGPKIKNSRGDWI